jgi:radical SAM-linked protein
MTADSPSTACSTPPGSNSTEESAPVAQAETRHRLRLRFRKGQDLRLLSHHDLMRTFERMLRRAEIPFRRSQGFHPKPRLTFALSLPLGVVGCAELADVELDRHLPIEEIRQRLLSQAPPGLEIHSVEYVDRRRTAQVRRLCYRVAIPPERRGSVAARIAAIQVADDLWVERKRPPVRRVNLRPFLSELRIVESDQSEQRESGPRPPACPFLEMELWLKREGTARPEEVLALLGLEDLIEAGTVLERVWLELHEDISSARESDPESERAQTGDPATPAECATPAEEPDATDPFEEGTA